MLALHLRVPPSLVHLCERHQSSFYSQLYIPNFPHCLYITQGTPFVVVVPCTGFYASRGLQWARMICPVSLVYVFSHQRRLVEECWGSDLQLYNNRFPVRVSQMFFFRYISLISSAGLSGECPTPSFYLYVFQCLPSYGGVTFPSHSPCKGFQ
jgi:hypothetical protein